MKESSCCGRIESINTIGIVTTRVLRLWRTAKSSAVRGSGSADFALSNADSSPDLKKRADSTRGDPAKGLVENADEDEIREKHSMLKAYRL